MRVHMEQEEHSNFPIKIDDRLVQFLQKSILFGIKILAILMTIVILWSVIDVGIHIYEQALKPPYFLSNLEDILEIFGAVLVVLIAIEIFLNIILYLKKDIMHLKLVLATALMAIARKVIVLDYEKVSSFHLYGVALIIMALGFSYWLINKPHVP
jgi:uncharacterized membrane protein (DUF373 family)